MYRIFKQGDDLATGEGFYPRGLAFRAGPLQNYKGKKMETKENGTCCVKNERPEGLTRLVAKIWDVVMQEGAEEIEVLKAKNDELMERIKCMGTSLDFRQRLNEDLVKLLEQANKKLAYHEKKKDNLDFLDGQIQELEGILDKSRQWMAELEHRFNKPTNKTSAYDLSKVGEMLKRKGY